MNQSKNNVASINQKLIHIAPVPFRLVCLDSLHGWFLHSENFQSQHYTSHLCHSTRSRRRRRRIHIPKLNLALRERRTVAYVGCAPGKSIFTHSSPAQERTYSRGKRFSFARRFNCQVQQMNDPRRIPESVFSFFHIRVKVYLLSELKEYEKYRTI